MRDRKNKNFPKTADLAEQVVSNRWDRLLTDDYIKQLARAYLQQRIDIQRCYDKIKKKEEAISDEGDGRRTRKYNPENYTTVKECLEEIDRLYEIIDNKEEYKFGCYLHEMDVEAFFNIREYVREALEAKGAKMTGAGIGMGAADLWMEIEEYEYFIKIKPCEKN